MDLTQEQWAWIVIGIAAVLYLLELIFEGDL
jgi:hypothetical protein